MAIEQKWPAVAPQALTANGTAQGLITVADTAGFKVKQRIVLTSSSISAPQITLRVIRINSTTSMKVGPLTFPQGHWNMPQDVSSYTTSNTAFVYAEEQDKAKLKPDDIFQAVYDQEPTVALRNVLVDKYGNYYDANNPLPVLANVSVTIPPLSVRRLTDKSGDTTPDGFPDAMQIGNGINRLKINSDGSINANTSSSGVSTVVQLAYNEVTSVASGVSTTVATYVAPPGLTNAFLQKIFVSGDNVARYDVFVNSTAKGTIRSSFTEFNAKLDFLDFNNTGFTLATGDTVTVKVIHNRPSLASFNATIQVAETT